VRKDASEACIHSSARGASPFHTPFLLIKYKHTLDANKEKSPMFAPMSTTVAP